MRQDPRAYPEFNRVTSFKCTETDENAVLLRKSTCVSVEQRLVSNTRSDIMFFDSDVEKARRAQREAERDAEEAREKLAAARKAARAATGKATKLSESRTATAHAIYTPYEEAGFSREHAPALFYLRSLDLERFNAALGPFAQAKPGKRLIVIEYDAVTANLEEWSRRGEQLYYEKEVRAYERECKNFEQWQNENPDEKGWRELPASRRQYFLMWRTAIAEDIDYPRRVKRGVAHDWLVEHGANLRLKRSPPVSDDSNGENRDG